MKNIQKTVGVVNFQKIVRLELVPLIVSAVVLGWYVSIDMNRKSR